MIASVRLYGLPAGVLKAELNGSLTFQYTEDWIAGHRDGKAHMHALSLRMPIRSEPYGNDIAHPFFDGLLPESKAVRRALAQRLQIDEHDDFGLLLQIGRECQGAISIVEPDAPIMDERRLKPSYHVIEEDHLAALIADLPVRPLFIDADGELRLSLAGVHGKAAVLRVGGRIAIPHGNTPTTHILKVDIRELKDSIKVEHFCLNLAGELGISIPKARIATAEGIPYMLLSRYDRVAGANDDGPYIRRLHQEDFCQALGHYPSQKYEKEGGPNWSDCFALMNRMANPLEARMDLLRRALFQYLVNNPDAHSKNYSIVYHSSGAQLSKLYDVNNAAAFKAQFKEVRPRLAMSIGGQFDPTKLTIENWRQFASDIGMRPSGVLSLLSEMAEAMPTKAINLRQKLAGSAVDSKLLDIVIDDVTQRCNQVSAMITTQAAADKVRQTGMDQRQ